ncbi:hypothetical protein D3C71_1564180 [compost metagenome]
MIMMEYNTVLVVVNIWRVLKEPFLIIQLKWNDTQVLARRMINPTSIPNILAAQQTFWIYRRREQAGHSNFLRTLLRLGQIDGHLDVTVRRILQPVDILGNPVHPDIVGIYA